MPEDLIGSRQSFYGIRTYTSAIRERRPTLSMACLSSTSPRVPATKHESKLTLSQAAVCLSDSSPGGSRDSATVNSKSRYISGSSKEFTELRPPVRHLSRQSWRRRIIVMSSVHQNDRQVALSAAEDHEDPWQEWYLMEPLERWYASMKLWQFFLRVGGSLDPEPDCQSPFDADCAQGSVPADGRSGLRVLRRGRV